MRYLLKNYGSFYLTFILLLIVGKLSPVLFYGTFTLFQLFLIRRGRTIEQFLSLVIIIFLSDGPIFYQFTDSYKVVMLLLTFLNFYKLNGFSSLSKDMLIFIPFALLAIFGSINSNDVSISIQKSVSYCLALLLFYNLINVGDLKEKLPEFLSLLIFTAFLILLFGHVLKFFFGNTFLLVEGRYNGMMRNPNGLGLFSLLFFILLFSLNRMKILIFSNTDILIIGLLIILNIVMSGSRNSLFGTIVFLVFYRFNKIHPVITVLAFAVFLYLNAFYEQIIGFVATTFGLEEYLRIDTVKEASGRIVAWEFIYERLSIFDYFGRGFYSTELLFTKYRMQLSVLGHQGNAHNSFLTLWYDTGLLGVILLIIGFISLFLKLEKALYVGIPAMFTIFFLAFFESWLAGSLNPFTPMMLLLLSLNNVKFNRT